jgi:hypothetical protein
MAFNNPSVHVFPDLKFHWCGGLGLYCRLKLSRYKFSGAFGAGSSYFSRAHGLALMEYDKKRRKMAV